MNKHKSPPPYKRRNFYIDKKFQNDFMVRFWGIVAIGSLFTIVAVYELASNTTTIGIMDGRITVHSTAEYLLPLLFQTFAIELVIVSLLTIIMTLFISHKIAGPLYRLKMTLKDLGNGNLKHMFLRQGDQLKEVAASYNESIDKLNEKINKIRNASSMDEVKKILDTFKSHE